MIIIINTSTLIGSGVTQVATSFLYECLSLKNTNKYHVFLGKKVGDSINQLDFDNRFIFYNIPIKPLDILSGGIKSIKQMKEIERQLKPDVVFTVFGPSWWTPKSPHLQGFAHPYYVYPEGPIFKIISIRQKLQLKLHEFIYIFFLKRNGEYFVTETDFVSKRLEKLLSLGKGKVFTASNTCNAFFRNFKNDKRITFLPEKKEDEFRFISLCTMQMHKNLTILNKVIPLLKERGFNSVKFVLTIDELSFKNKFNDNIKDCVHNIGSIAIENCPYLFNECDALFLPTLAECFTANYPEAMILQKPILTSKLPFAEDICNEAALYFSPCDEFDIVEKILLLINDVKIQQDLVREGNKVIERFLTPSERAIKYLDVLYKISGPN